MRLATTRRALFLAGVLVAGGAWAQRGFDKPPAPAPARPLQVPGFAQTRLPNGLGVVAVERRQLPLVTALLLVETGSLMDPPGKAGLAELSLTLLAKGAIRGTGGAEHAADAGDIAHAAEGLGGSIEIGSGAQASRIAMTVAANRLDDSLALLSDLLRRPTLAADELERSRAQELDAIKLSLSDPGLLAEQLGRRLYWGDTPAGLLATPASLARIRREDVQAFHRQQIRPDRVTLILAGDVDLAQALALADRHFGNWKPNRMALPVMPQQAPRPLAPALLVDMPGAGQSAVVLLAPYAALGQPADPSGMPEQRAAAVAQAVLGLGYSSRINQEVRIKRGLSYGASSTAEALPGGGLLSASAQTKHGSAAEVAQLLRAEILRLAGEEVPAAELAARQALLVGDFGRALETTAGLATVAADQLQRRRELAELALLPAELQAVDAARVRGFAASYWKPERLQTVIVADLKEAGEALTRQFPEAWLIRAEELDLGSANLRRPGRK